MRVGMGRTRNRSNTIHMERISVFNKAITVQVTHDLHSEIKKRASFRNIPMSRWITRVIVKYIKKERDFE